MSNAHLKPYPSGFLGSADIEQTEHDSEKHTQRMINQIMNRFTAGSTDSINTSSSEIKNIWAELLSKTDFSQSFEFKDKVIKLALVAFGTEYFSEWVSSQSQNPNFTKLHHDYIDDTINFVFRGKRRSYTLNNWLSLLDDSQASEGNEKYTPIQIAFFSEENINKIGFTNDSVTIEQLVKNWVGQEGGIEDLTLSLYVLFGDR